MLCKCNFGQPNQNRITNILKVTLGFMIITNIITGNSICCSVKTSTCVLSAGRIKELFCEFKYQFTLEVIRAIGTCLKSLGEIGKTYRRQAPMAFLSFGSHYGEIGFI